MLKNILRMIRDHFRTQYLISPCSSWFGFRIWRVYPVGIGTFGVCEGWALDILSARQRLAEIVAERHFKKTAPIAFDRYGVPIDPKNI